MLMKFVVTIQQDINVEAETEEAARYFAMRNIPHTHVGGAGRHGSYSLQTLNKAKVISIEEYEEETV